MTSVSAVAATLGNIGPGLGSVGPELTFSQIPQIGKVVLSFLMLMGRLELFTVILCFTPGFWKGVPIWDFFSGCYKKRKESHFQINN